MKKSLLPLLMLSFLSHTVLADNLTMPSDDRRSAAENSSADESLKTLVEYVKNLGIYLGFDLTQKPKEEIKTQLIDLEERQGSLLNLINTGLGAVSVPSQGTGKNGTFVTTSGEAPISASINDLSNSTFSIPNTYNSPTKDTITAQPLVDQKTYQTDPISQSVLNLLATPDQSYCMNESGQWNSTKSENSPDCTFMYSGQVLNNVIGNYPDNFFSNEYNKPLLSQLNANSLITPLMYSYIETAPQDADPSKGLRAANQAQEAANFVRYAISDTLPMPLANKFKYQKFLRDARNVEQNTNFADQKKAQNILGNYLVSLRVFAAQRSVAVANLYNILSRRIPQMSLSKNTKPTSTALSEFTLAAWRLKDIKDQSGSTPNRQWLEQINKASSSTVQKEIAVLLAEINYQMYLARQQQERLLLTNTMILMQEMKEKTPSLDRSIGETEVSSVLPKEVAP